MAGPNDGLPGKRREWLAQAVLPRGLPPVRHHGPWPGSGCERFQHGKWGKAGAEGVLLSRERKRYLAAVPDAPAGAEGGAGGGGEEDGGRLNGEARPPRPAPRQPPSRNLGGGPRLTEALG
jgi:hypothetical protein